ncbi:hypothetical protein THAOC_09722, partial [Thalassiosira oceanica]
GGSRPLAYDTNKTRRAEAPFGPAGDGNGRRYEPPPRDRIGLVTAFMPSRRRLPAAPGKPSFPYFKVYYLPRRCVLAEPSQRTCDVESPRLDGARKIRRPWPQPPESEDWGRPPRVGEDGILPYRLALATILAVKWASCTYGRVHPGSERRRLMISVYPTELEQEANRQADRGAVVCCRGAAKQGAPNTDIWTEGPGGGVDAPNNTALQRLRSIPTTSGLTSFLQ